MNIDIKIGQIWEYNVFLCGILQAIHPRYNSKKDILELTGPLTAIEIVTINNVASDGRKYHECDILRDDSAALNQFIDDSGLIRLDAVDLLKAIESNEWTILYEPKESKCGATCSACKDFFPYADFSETFQCWKCRNGL